MNSRLLLAHTLVRFACRSISRSLLRSSLTALSLVIGIAAVIAMVGIGNGAKARVQESIAALDLNRMSLSARLQDGLNMRVRFPNGSGLTVDDYQAIRSGVPGLVAVSPYMESMAAGSVGARGRSSRAKVIGMDVDGIKLQSRQVLRGGIFGPGDVLRSANVCVITGSAAKELFGDEDPVGELIQVKESPFTVIGVIGDKMSASETGDLFGEAAQILIPYTSLLRRIDRSAGDSMKILMRAGSPEILPALKQQVSNMMEQRRGKRKVEFAILTTADLAETYTTSSNALALLLALISAISLLVGGVGIMNVMLMSVKERTREIGIRVAIGARGCDVLGQMLLEAVIVSVLGGTIGVIVGLSMASVVSRWNDWPLLITPGTVAGAFFLSLCIGVFFGYYPARRAARLNPIEALRAD